MQTHNDERAIRHNGWVITYWASEDEDDGFCWSLMSLRAEDDAYMSIKEVASQMVRDYDEIERKIRNEFNREVAA